MREMSAISGLRSSLEDSLIKPDERTTRVLEEARYNSKLSKNQGSTFRINTVKSPVYQNKVDRISALKRIRNLKESHKASQPKRKFFDETEFRTSASHLQPETGPKQSKVEPISKVRKVEKQESEGEEENGEEEAGNDEVEGEEAEEEEDEELVSEGNGAEGEDEEFEN